MPPWPHGEQATTAVPSRMRKPLPPESTAWKGKFVVMYSGNHAFSPTRSTRCSTRRCGCRTARGWSSLFIGGGVRKAEVDDAIAGAPARPTCMSLPYQPLEKTRWSRSRPPTCTSSRSATRSSASSHPCKVYGAMALARPILYMGPKPSHVSRTCSSRTTRPAASAGRSSMATSTPPIRMVDRRDPLRRPREELRSDGPTAPPTRSSPSTSDSDAHDRAILRGGEDEAVTRSFVDLFRRVRLSRRREPADQSGVAPSAPAGR